MDFRRDSLAVRKAWAFFDDVIVWLGSAISDNSSDPVITSINQCHLKGAAATFAENPLSPDTQISLEGTGWVWHDNTGYIFPESCNLNVSNKSQSGCWADIGVGSPTEEIQDVFSLWIDHDTNPNNAHYVCVVYPEINLQDIEHIIAAPKITVVENTPDMQAIYNEKADLLSAVFYAPGGITYSDARILEANQPSLVILRETPQTICITAANPCNEALEVQFTFNILLDGESCEHSADDKTRITLSLTEGNRAGSSITRSDFLNSSET